MMFSKPIARIAQLFSLPRICKALMKGKCRSTVLGNRRQVENGIGNTF